ncbi:hypothetical protein [Gaoshiqia sp. Z1-71]|uniref:hypothetical protein n=1 Tax=Gaoshiqia hydrogeniformans TaxID=3290090 RepID=UPI003BF80AE6
MEYEELVSLWGKFDDKLNRLEELNTIIIKEKLIKKPKRKLNFFKYKTIENMLIFPLVILLLISPNIIAMDYDWKFFLGGAFVLSILVYVVFINIKTYRAFSSLNIGIDSVIESAKKSNKIKQIFKARYKYARFNMPIIFAGVLLIKWDAINFNLSMMIFISTLFITLFIYNIFGPNIHKNMIKKWTMEIDEFNEYM